MSLGSGFLSSRGRMQLLALSRLSRWKQKYRDPGWEGKTGPDGRLCRPAFWGEWPGQLWERTMGIASFRGQGGQQIMPWGAGAERSSEGERAFKTFAALLYPTHSPESLSTAWSSSLFNGDLSTGQTTWNSNSNLSYKPFSLYFQSRGYLQNKT